MPGCPAEPAGGGGQAGPAHPSAPSAEFCIRSRRARLPAEAPLLAGSELGVTLRHRGGSSRTDVTFSAAGAGLKDDPQAVVPHPFPAAWSRV